jgi:hypothetical protein
MRWAGHVAYVKKKRNARRVSVVKPEGKNHYEDPELRGKVILEWILEKY